MILKFRATYPCHCSTASAPSLKIISESRSPHRSHETSHEASRVARKPLVMQRKDCSQSNAERCAAHPRFSTQVRRRQTTSSLHHTHCLLISTPTRAWTTSIYPHSHYSYCTDQDTRSNSSCGWVEKLFTVDTNASTCTDNVGAAGVRAGESKRRRVTCSLVGDRYR